MKGKTRIIYETFHLMFYIGCFLYVYIYGVETNHPLITKESLCWIIVLFASGRVKVLGLEILDYRHKNKKNK